MADYKKKSLYLILVFLALVLVKFSYAHDTSLAYTYLKVDEDEISVNVTVPNSNFNIVPGENISGDFKSKAANYVMSGIGVSNNNEACAKKLFNISDINEGTSTRYTILFTCREPANMLNFSYNLFFEKLQSHENVLDVQLYSQYARLTMDNEYNYLEIPVQKLIIQYGISNITQSNISNVLLASDDENSTNKLAPPVFSNENAFRKSLSFFVLGVKHILTGYDHLLFLLGLLIVTLSLVQLAKVVTSFTIAHSITLAAATFGAVILPPRITESVIALSISYVAVENIYSQRDKSESTIPKFGFRDFFGNPKRRWMITFLFGLVHGFGFSRVLRELGLPKGGVAISLLMFNLGVEAGQFLVIFLLFPFLWYSGKKHWHGKMVTVVSSVIGVTGFFWFAQRLFGF